MVRLSSNLPRSRAYRALAFALALSVPIGAGAAARGRDCASAYHFLGTHGAATNSGIIWRGEDAARAVPDALRAEEPRLRAFWGPAFRTDLEIDIDGSRWLHDSSFVPGHVPRVTVGLLGEAAVSDRLRAALAHEIGHHVFIDLFRARFGDEVSGFREALRRIDDLRSAARRSGDFRSEAAIELRRLQKDFDALDGAANPYAELFGDLAAALYVHDPAVMADLVGFPREAPFFSRFETPRGSAPLYREANPEGPRPRDFGARAGFKNWRDEGENRSVGRPNDYTMFDPVRGALGGWIENGKLSSQTNTSDILVAYVRAAGRHIEERRQGFARGQPPASLSEMNRRFLGLLREELGAAGVWR